ncbi:F-box-like domain superfamily [Arabidopsis thaliana x Arabidopsis arenosa]|uniref:F-box-like domain superfamily n=1 Tax=Arabidopsis thaliana x Arabidopsis arenosa TaxID=1240361 RepID=A0A8T2BLJ4_9BRAS|nr:F-box-like domain superfamily [Arabidopsis thaliana x Arabidopsis arenosa]
MVDCDWSNLPEELLRLIAVRLFSVVELKRFRSICTYWRSSISGADKNNPFPIRRLIHFDPCLNTKGSNQFYTSFRLVILSRAAFFRVTPSSSSNKGWLIKSDTKINSGKFRLLDPFSRLALPHSCESLDLLEFTVSEIQESYAVLEKTRGRTAREFKKVVVVKVGEREHKILGISSDKNIKSWTGIDWSRLKEADHQFSDIIIHKRRTYALNLKGVVCLISSSLKIIEFGPLFDETVTNGCFIEKSLVECCGELYIIERLFEENSRKRKADSSDGNGKGKTVGFKVYKMDEELVKWKEVKSLGDNAFVMATDTCFSVLAHEFYGCLQNSIYFTDNEEKMEKVIKVFKLDNGNGSIETMSEPCQSCFQMFVPSFL